MGGEVTRNSTFSNRVIVEVSVHGEGQSCMDTFSSLRATASLDQGLSYVSQLS